MLECTGKPGGLPGLEGMAVPSIKTGNTEEEACLKQDRESMLDISSASDVMDLKHLQEPPNEDVEKVTGHRWVWQADN